MKTFTAIIALALLAGFFTSGRIHAEDDDDRPAPSPSAASGDHAAPTRALASSQSTVSLTTESASRLTLRIVPARQAHLADTLQLTGTVAINEDRTARLSPRMEGIARQVLHTVGDQVAKDEPLVQLESIALGTAKVEFLRLKQEVELARAELTRKAQLRDSVLKVLGYLREDPAPLTLVELTHDLAAGEHRSRLITAYSNLRLARTNHEREKLLFRQKVSATKTYQEAARDLETAEATFRTAVDEVRFNSELEQQTAEKVLKTKEAAFRSARLQLDVLGATDDDVRELERGKDRDLALTTLRAPFAGTILERRATTGERVTPETSLFTIADLSELWVLSDVYEADWARLRSGLAASIRVTAYPGRSFPGTVRVLPPLLDVATRTARIRVAVDNRVRLLAGGMFATVDVAVATSAALAIPVAALQTLEGKSNVFVKVGERSYRAVPVVTGRQDDRLGLVEVRSGIREGDQVVAEGSFLLKSELSKDGLEDKD